MNSIGISDTPSRARRRGLVRNDHHEPAAPDRS